MLALLGGSFDPVHLGHLHLCNLVLEQPCIDRLVLVPAHINNFKQFKGPDADGPTRLRLLELALKDFEDIYGYDKYQKICVSNCEIERSGVSYTYDTVLFLKSQYHIDGPIALVIGDDLVENLSSWYSFPLLCKEVKFLIFRRLPVKPALKIHGSDFDYEEIDNPVMVQSATQIREGEMDGLSPRVLSFIQRRGLYDNFD